MSSSQKDEISTSLGALIVELLSLGDSHETFPSLINVRKTIVILNFFSVIL
jgi:hypothetical protein